MENYGRKKMKMISNYLPESTLDYIIQDLVDNVKRQVIDESNSEISFIINENKKLKEENEELQKSINDITSQNNDNNLFDSIWGSIKNNLMKKVPLEEQLAKNNKVYDFLSLIYDKDYVEKLDANTPLWIGILTQWYSHKNEMIQIMQSLAISTPKNISNFRLPVDWTEEELDTFFDTIYNHTNCNGCTYEGNLRFWSDSSLEDVKTQCNRSYSEIPWQYVLRNPLLKNEKYLAAIGKGAYLSKCSNYFKFFKIETYQDLTDEQIKVIIDNMEYQKMNKSDEIDTFLLKHIDLISNEHFLNRIYDRFNNSYSFEVYDCVLNIPYKYAYKWLTEHKNKAIQFLDKYPEHFTQEQRKEIITKIFNL